MKKLLFITLSFLVFAYSCESDDEIPVPIPLTELLIGNYELDRASENGVYFYDGTQGCPDILEITPNSVIWETPNNECTDYETTIGVYEITDNWGDDGSGLIRGWFSDNFFYEEGDDDYIETLWMFKGCELTVWVYIGGTYPETAPAVTYRFHHQIHCFD